MAETETLTEQPVRRAHLHSSYVARAGIAIRSLAVRDSLAVWILTRVAFLGLTYFAVVFHANGMFQGAHPGLGHNLLPAWGTRWDAVWYEDIARRGYDWQRAVGTRPTAFFPLFPMLMHALVVVTHRSYALAGLLVSNLAFLGALIYLWKLTSRELGKGVARRTLLYIAVFPTALFFFAGYTESLFLFLSVGGLFHLRRREWLLAGIFAGLASATRVTGVLLLLPLAYDYAAARDFDWRRVDWRIVSLLLAPAGLVAFMLYLHVSVGDALAFSHSQGGWQKTFTWRLWEGFWQALRQIFVAQPNVSLFQAENVINAVLGGLALIWSAFAARRLPRAYGIYLAAFWLVTLASPALAGGYPVPLVSLSRYVLALFPVFMYLGVTGRRREYHDLYLVLSTGTLALLTIVFVDGLWFV